MKNAESKGKDTETLEHVLIECEAYKEERKGFQEDIRRLGNRE